MTISSQSNLLGTVQLFTSTTYSFYLLTLAYSDGQIRFGFFRLFHWALSAQPPDVDPSTLALIFNSVRWDLPTWPHTNGPIRTPFVSAFFSARLA